MGQQPVTSNGIGNEHMALLDDVSVDLSAIKDGQGTKGITPPKSTWALPLDTPPYRGFAVTTGISFTFGGLHITADAQVIDTELKPMRGLYAAGELVVRAQREWLRFWGGYRPT
ncbi:FAD-binding protein [Lacticaseibacillus rhamnosus]